MFVTDDMERAREEKKYQALGEKDKCPTHDIWETDDTHVKERISIGYSGCFRERNSIRIFRLARVSVCVGAVACGRNRSD